MQIDLTSLMRQAEEEVKNADSKNGSGNSNGYPLVYPGEKGKITFRILYNIKSQTIHRKVIRHGKLPCMSVYGEECPVCTAIKNAEEVKGKECGAFGKYGYKVRGICYAKVTDADSAYSDRFEVGDTIILMYPKTVYEAINKIIVDAGPNLEKIVSHNDGIPLVLETTQKNNSFPDYDVHLFPYGSQILFKEANGEELFDKLLEEIPSLSDTIISKFPTEEDRQKVKAMAETITQEYIYGNVVNPDDELPFKAEEPNNDTKSVNPAFTGTPQSQQDTTVSDTTSGNNVQNSSATEVPEGVPECYGKHSDTDNKCLICTQESQCFMKTHRG